MVKVVGVLNKRGVLDLLGSVLGSKPGWSLVPWILPYFVIED